MIECEHIKKCAEVAIAGTQKRCMISEKELKEDTEVKLAVQLNVRTRELGFQIKISGIVKKKIIYLLPYYA